MTDAAEARFQLVQESYRRSEKRLDAQLTLAVGSDQRSLLFAGVAIAAAAFTFDAFYGKNGFELALGAAALFSMSAVFCALAAMSGRMFTPGGEYSNMQEQIDKNANLEGTINDLGQKNDIYIQANERAQKMRMHAYNFGIILFSTAALFLFGALTITPV